jgi:segregation and condensation protein B
MSKKNLSDETEEEYAEEELTEEEFSEGEFSEEDLKNFSSEEEALAETEPEVSEEEMLAREAAEEKPEVEVSGSELESFESAEIEDVQFIDDDQLCSIVESLLFANDRPITLAAIKMVFKGTNVKTKHIKAALDLLASDYASSRRGFTLEEVSSGYQLRTKSDNVTFLRQGVKARPFKLSGPALEVMSIVAYKQPLTKSEIDQIRGVESGHLLRALMEKGLVAFGEKSDLPGKPMFYQSTKKFLEIFGLRNIKELPSLHEIDQLIPEGIGEEEEKETLGDLTEGLSQEVGSTYSEGEDELIKISNQLDQISTSSEFFEQEKERAKLARDKERARDIRDAIALGEEVAQRDLNWLEKFEESLRVQEAGEQEVAEVLEAAGVSAEGTDAVVDAAEQDPTEVDSDKESGHEEPPRDLDL